MTDLIKQARELCETGHDEGYDVLEMATCMEALADALEKAKGEIEGLDKDAAAKYLEIVRLTARAEKAEAERDAAVKDITHDCWHCAEHDGELEMCPKGKALTKVYTRCPYWKYRGAKEEG